MTEPPQPPLATEPVPSKDSAPKPLTKILWVFAAFMPSVLTLGIMQWTSVAPGLGEALLIFNAVCSLAAAIGLVRGFQEVGTRVALAIFLTGLFFVANVVLTVLIGCAALGRNAP